MRFAGAQSACAVFKLLATKSSLEELVKYQVPILDDFHDHWPNGVHWCLIYEAMAASTAAIVDEFSANRPAIYGDRMRYPRAVVKKFVKQLIQSIALLHQHGVVHSEVQPSNVVLALANTSTLDAKKLRQDSRTLSPASSRVVRTLDESALRYLTRG